MSNGKGYAAALVLVVALCSGGTAAGQVGSDAAGLAVERSCKPGFKPATMGCIPENASEVATGLWACDPPYFRSLWEDQCIREAGERNVYIHESGFLAGMAQRRANRGGGIREASDSCCSWHGGVARDEGGAPICAAGRLLCQDGRLSPVCNCSPARPD